MLKSVTRTVVAVLASGTLAVAAVGCGDDDDDPNDPTDQPTDTTQPAGESDSEE